MSQQFNYEGTFRGRIVDYTIHESTGESQSVGLNIKVAVEDYFNPAEEHQCWENWRDWAYEVFGYVNLIGKDGTTNDRAVENFCRCTGWNGSFSDIATGDFQPTPIQFTTKAEEYKGKLSYKVNFINPYDADPMRGSGFKKVDPATAKALQAKYGQTLRALAGSTKKPAPAGGRPSAPPPRQVIGSQTGNGSDTDGNVPY